MHSSQTDINADSQEKAQTSKGRNALLYIITELGKSHTKAKHELLKLEHQAQQKTVTDEIPSTVLTPNHQTTPPHSLWDLLWRYKTDHVQSSLSAQTHDIASLDPRIWKLGPLTFDPQAWHHFRYALRHHLLKYKSSPYNEVTAHKLAIHSVARALLHKVEHPVLPVDPLFHEEITRQKFVNEITKFNSDKSLVDDGITNRIIQAAGPKFKVSGLCIRDIWHPVKWHATNSVADVTYAANS